MPDRHGELLNGVLKALGYIESPDPVWIKLAIALHEHRGDTYRGVPKSLFLKRARDDVKQPPASVEETLASVVQMREEAGSSSPAKDYLTELRLQ